MYADSISVSNTVLCQGPLRRDPLSGWGGYDCLVKVFKTKLSSPKRSTLLLKSIACSFEYFYWAVMVATVWRCDAAEQTAAQTALNQIHLPLPPTPSYHIVMYFQQMYSKNEDGCLYSFGSPLQIQYTPQTLLVSELLPIQFNHCNRQKSSNTHCWHGLSQNGRARMTIRHTFGKTLNVGQTRSYGTDHK